MTMARRRIPSFLCRRRVTIVVFLFGAVNIFLFFISIETDLSLGDVGPPQLEAAGQAATRAAPHRTPATYRALPRPWPVGDDGDGDDRIVKQLHLANNIKGIIATPQVAVTTAEAETGGFWAGLFAWVRPAMPSVPPPHRRDKPLAGLKKILVINGLYIGRDRVGRQQFVKDSCPVDACYVTTNSLDLNGEDADALIIRSYSDDLHSMGYTRRRTPAQIWVAYQLESPSFSSLSLLRGDNAVNWTATYRSSSTVVTPYEKFVTFPNSSTLPRLAPRDYSKGKQNMVAWFVSNCKDHNGRWQYAHALSRYVSVDIFGDCGALKCDRGDARCPDMLRRKYRFYLSFENSNCKEYITEKLYWNAYK